MINLIWKKTIWCCCFIQLVWREQFLHDMTKTVTKGPRCWDMLNKPTSHLLGELSINKSQIGESHKSQPCRARDRVVGRQSSATVPHWNLHSLNRNPERSFEELPSALWQKTGKQSWNQGLWGAGRTVRTSAQRKVLSMENASRVGSETRAPLNRSAQETQQHKMPASLRKLDPKPHPCRISAGIFFHAHIIHTYTSTYTPLTGGLTRQVNGKAPFESERTKH